LKFTVSGEREGSAAAITAQRNAGNVKSIVATDAFGHVVDGNIGEMLKRVSGISTNLNEGEVDQVFVRGIGSAFSAVTLDGTRLPSPAKGKKEGVGRQAPGRLHRQHRGHQGADARHGRGLRHGTVNAIAVGAALEGGACRTISASITSPSPQELVLRRHPVFGRGGRRISGVFSFATGQLCPQDVAAGFRECLFPRRTVPLSAQDAVHKRNRTGAGLKPTTGSIPTRRCSRASCSTTTPMVDQSG
jgi:hypothetical protein